MISDDSSSGRVILNKLAIHGPASIVQFCAYEAPLMREAKKVSFLKEVRQMMYGYGDVDAPRPDTADVLHGYLIDYLTILLTKTHNMAKIKGKTKTEDLMYFLRRDRRKYSRVKSLLITNEELKVARKIFERKEYEHENADHS